MRKVGSKVLQKVVEQSYDAIIVTNGSFDEGGPLIVFANDAFCSMTGYAEAEVLGRNPRFLQGPETDEAVLAGLRAALGAGVYWEGEAVNYRKNGQPYQVRWNISPIRDDDGAVEYFVSIQSDVTAEREARREQQLLAGALDAASDAIAVIDASGRILAANRALGTLSGRDPHELVERGLHETLIADGEAKRGADGGDDGDLAWLGRLQRSQTEREVVALRTPAGERRFVEVRISTMPTLDGPDTTYVLLASDATERVEAERELWDQAHHDDLTGLLNRRAGDDDLARIVADSADRRRTFVAILADIDHFKQVNDTHGHGVGDRLLVSFAEVLRDTCRDEDTIVRWGGEEFLILLDDTSLDAGRRLAERLRTEVKRVHDREAGPMSASFGVTAARTDDTPTSLIERADEALYAAKEAGRDRVEVA